MFWVAGLGAVASELVENQEWFAVHFKTYAKKLELLREALMVGPPSACQFHLVEMALTESCACGD